MRHGGRQGDLGPDLAPASADQTLIGRDQRDVGIDPEPALAREYLDIEMQMAAGAVGAVQVIRNHTDFLAFLDMTSVHNAVGVQARGVHMHIAKAYMFVAGVDLQRRRLRFRRADHDTVADGSDRLPVGLAAIGAFVMWRTRRGPDILPLMPKTAGALSHPKTARFAKVILPGIAGISANRLVQHQRLVVRSAASE